MNATAMGQHRWGLLESPASFARICLRIAVALGIAAAAGVIDRLFAIPLAVLIALFAVLARLVEEDTLDLPTELEPETADVAPSVPVVVGATSALREAPLPEVATVVRTFRLPASVGAERVWLVGDFNGWSRTANPMRRDGDVFIASLNLVRGRAYRYRYLLDGARWENDWDADAYVGNEFGTEDSLVRP